MTEFVFSEIDRKYGKAVGVKKADGDFRCYECVDFSFYQRGVHSGDAGEKCTYCAGPVFITPAMIVEMEAPKRVRPVNLDKGHAGKFDVLTIAHNLGQRLRDVSFAYDKAIQRIAELETQLAMRDAEDAGFVETTDV
ncbi:hypothetical protein ACWDCL_01760 [Streptomyces sp. NPDC001009]